MSFNRLWGQTLKVLASYSFSSHCSIFSTFSSVGGNGQVFGSGGGLTRSLQVHYSSSGSTTVSADAASGIVAAPT